MIEYTDGSRFDGHLKIGQVWVKGNRERTIVDFGPIFIYYKTKTDIKNGTTTGILRSSFRKWATSGAKVKK